MTQNPTLTELRRTAALAFPLILAQLAQVSLTLIDTLMVGRLGNEALAGIALGSSVFMMGLIVGMGVMFAVGPTVSQAHGAGDEVMVARATRQGLWLALGLTVPALVLFWSAAPLLTLMGQDAQTVRLASGYLQAISWGYLPALWLVGLRGLLEGLSKPRPIMLIAFAGIGLNIFANNTLMFGRLGFPALGLVGTGWASTFVFWMTFLLGALYVQRTLPQLEIFTKVRTPDLSVLRDLFLIGWPIGLTLGFEGGLFSVTRALDGLSRHGGTRRSSNCHSECEFYLYGAGGLGDGDGGARGAGGGAQGRSGGAAGVRRRYRPQLGLHGADRADLLAHP